jgi:hypothetical protein
MRVYRLDIVLLFGAATVAYALVAVSLPHDRGIATHIYELAIGLLLMLIVLSQLRQSSPRLRSRFDAALRTSDAPAPPVRQIEQLEREVVLAIGSAYDLHVRLVPQLRAIATARLALSGRRAGPETLGRWWELLRPDRPEPSDRFAPGLPRHELRALVDDLERL